MTTLTDSQQHADVPGRSLALWMVAAVPLSALMQAIYYYGGIGGTRDDTPLRATVVASAVGALAALAVWRFGRSAYGSARGTKVMAVLAVVSIIGFWVGLTFPVALAAVLFGREAFAKGERGVGSAAMAAGVVVLVAATVLCVLGAS